MRACVCVYVCLHGVDFLHAARNSTSVKRFHYHFREPILAQAKSNPNVRKQMLFSFLCCCCCCFSLGHFFRIKPYAAHKRSARYRVAFQSCANQRSRKRRWKQNDDSRGQLTGKCTCVCARAHAHIFFLTSLIAKIQIYPAGISCVYYVS